MTEWLLASSLGFVSGGAFVWLCKDKIMLVVKGSNALAADLRAKAARIEAAL